MKRLIKLLFLASILTAIVFSIYFLINWVNDKKFDVEITIKEKENIEFGFNLDNFKVQRDTIRFGDSFGEIMLRNKLSYSQIYNIVQSIKDSFDVRWLTTCNNSVKLFLGTLVLLIEIDHCRNQKTRFPRYIPQWP